MSQKTKGIHSLLSNTFFYSFSQKIMSGTSFREKIVKSYKQGLYNTYILGDKMYGQLISNSVGVLDLENSLSQRFQNYTN